MNLKPCTCAEARIVGEYLPEPARSAHDCEYIKWQNSMIPIADVNARKIAKEELAGNPYAATQMENCVHRHFHAEMNRLCAA